MYPGIFIAALCLTSFVDGKVSTLTDSDFNSVIVDHEFALIKFFTPGCPSCEKVAPIFDSAADVLQYDKPPVFLAEVDCARGGKLTCENLDVNGYPTLKFFKNGKKAFNYEGPQNSVDGVIMYVRSLVRPLSTELMTKEDVEKFRDHPEHCVIGFFQEKDSVIFERYEFFASTLNDRYRFAHTFSIDVRNYYGFNNTVFLYRSQRMKTTFEPDQIEYKGVYSPYKLRDWLLANIHGLVGHRTPGNAIDFYKPLVVVYYDVDFARNAKTSNYWRNRAMKVAKKFSDAGRKVNFAVSNTQSFVQELVSIGLVVDAGSDKPLVIGYDEADQKYVMQSHFTSEALEEFVESLLLGSLKPFKEPALNVATTEKNLKETDEKVPVKLHREQKTEL